MLNIPEDVKTLFKRDDVFKNFHVHFPNGETTDLNNDNIVSESVEFTESLCSQQSFRFGLTEASEIQFTAVGIPNVRGATIECAIEICVDDLGAEWLANNAPTGTEEFLDPQVCTYGSRNMYRVPYGRFIVDKCPRNHEGMWKREVTAYTSRTETDSVTNNFLVAMLNGYHPGVADYAPYVKPLAYSILFAESPESLVNSGYTAGNMVLGTGGGEDIKNVITAKTTGGDDIELTIAPTWKASPEIRPTHGDTDPFNTNLYGVKVTPRSTYIADIVANLETLGIDAVASGYESLEAMARACIDGLNVSYLAYNRYIRIGSTAAMYVERTKMPTESGLIYLYGIEMDSAEGGINGINIEICDGSRITANGTTYRATASDIQMTVYTDENAVSARAFGAITFTPTLETTMTFTVTGVTLTRKAKAFGNAFSLSGIAQGYLELQCLFSSPARTGGMEVTALDNTTSTAVLPSDYASLWYDETTISPIGYVALKFKDETGEEQDLTVQIGTGASVYDLSDNEVLKNMAFTVSKSEAKGGTTIESKLLAFLNSVFTPNIPDLSFVPIELEKKGLPYFEAGDAVTITTGDGQTVPSFILRQTIKGIQFLQADVESANGEAVELIES